MQPPWTASRGGAAACRCYMAGAEISGAGGRALGLTGAALQDKSNQGGHHLENTIQLKASLMTCLSVGVRVLLTRCVDEGRVELSCQQRVGKVSEELLQQSSYVMDAVLLVQVYVPPLVQLLVKLDENI